MILTEVRVVKITRFKTFFVYLSWLLVSVSCAYRHGALERSIPGGSKDVRVPIFKNLSQEVGIETSFTNALIDEISQSRVAQVNPQSEVEVLGTIESVQYFPLGKKTVGEMGSDQILLATDYRVVIVMEVVVKKHLDDKVLWADKFTGERSFTASQVSSPIVSSANPLYNLSAKRRNIAELAQDLVAEATDKMTENF